jgi:hypothetical protein
MNSTGITLQSNKIAQTHETRALQTPQTIEERETYLLLNKVVK